MSQDAPTAMGRPAWWEPYHPRRWEYGLFWLLSDRTVGGESVPLSWAHTTLADPRGKGVDCEYCVAFTNDAFEVAIGYAESDRYSLILRRPVLNQLVRWYLWQWAVYEWCGLRRWLWYRLLMRHLARHRRWIAKQRAPVEAGA